MKNLSMSVSEFVRASAGMTNVPVSARRLPCITRDLVRMRNYTCLTNLAASFSPGAGMAEAGRQFG